MSRSRLRAAIEDGEVVFAPLALDALTARIAVLAGFKAVYVSGGALGYAHAVSDKILIAPVNNMQDLLENEHLAFREFWQDVHQPGMDATFAVPGPYIKMSETPIEYLRAAPRIGEHNAEVFAEIRLTEDDLERLRTAGVV